MKRFLSFEDLSMKQSSQTMIGVTGGSRGAPCLTDALPARGQMSGFQDLGRMFRSCKRKWNLGSSWGLPQGPGKEQSTVSAPLGGPRAWQEVASAGPQRVKFLFGSRTFLKLFLVKSKCFQMTPQVGKCQALPRGFARQAEGPAMPSNRILHAVGEGPCPPSLLI